MIFRRRKHPLPKFPHNVASEFKQFCELLPDERVTEFIPEVSELIDHFRELSEKFSKLDLQRVEMLGERCIELLRLYPESKPAHKRMIVGAVRYFASTDDAVSETAFASGLDDDTKVLNHVLEEIGRIDLCVED